MAKQFSVKADLAVIEAGGFWCHACIVGHPAAEQSPDSRYCLSCYGIINGEKKLDVEQKANKDSWSMDGQTFITGGQGYRLKKDLTPVCVGLVGADGEPLAAPTTPSALIEQGAGAVTPPPQVPGEVCQSFVTNNKHPGGRPRKAGDDICRMTKWRRDKEAVQGALI